MSRVWIAPLPLRLGFRLTNRDIDFRRASGGRYRGIERGLIIPFEELLAQGDLPGVVNAYAETDDFETSLEAAEYFREALAPFCGPIEIVHGEVVWVPEQAPKPEAEEACQSAFGELLAGQLIVHERVGEQARGLPLVGFDVSVPVRSYHSAIASGGIGPTPNPREADLNDAGIFAELPAAVQFAEVANASLHGKWGLLFCVIEVRSDWAGSTAKMG